MSGNAPGVAGMLETLNQSVTDVSFGKCLAEGVPGPSHCNPHGTVHGGWYMALLDSAASIAIFSALGPGLMSSTATIEVKLLRPITLGKAYRAIGETLSVGGRLGHSRADMIDIETGERVAYALATCSIFSRQKWVDGKKSTK